MGPGDMVAGPMGVFRDPSRLRAKLLQLLNFSQNISHRAKQRFRRIFKVKTLPSTVPWQQRYHVRNMFSGFPSSK